MTENPFIHNPQSATHIHCVGIGGIGVSALARMLVEQKKIVTGSDATETSITQSLKKIGIHISIGPHRARHVGKDVQVIVYSPAVQNENPERKIARERGIVEVSYPEMIGHIMRSHVGITVSGTHGKSTTTALLGHILVFAKLDPTIIVGSFVRDLNQKNERVGKGEYMLVEADEYKASFLNYKPKIIVLTTIDEDHLDYYRDIRHILATFHEYILRLPKDGILIGNADDANTRQLLEQVSGYKLVYSRASAHADFYASDISLTTKGTSFVVHEGAQYARIETSLMGLHNVSNVLAAFSCARQLGIPTPVIISAIKRFKGLWRRFDVTSTKKGITCIDDYAHHPTEIKALIQALRQSYPTRRLILIFQPHQDDRFSKLFDRFTECFDGVDKIFLSEIYGVKGRQEKRDSSERLVPHLRARALDCSFDKNFEQLRARILATAQKGDVLVFVGAGDIIQLREKIERLLEKTISPITK